MIFRATYSSHYPGDRFQSFGMETFDALTKSSKKLIQQQITYLDGENTIAPPRIRKKG